MEKEEPVYVLVKHTCQNCDGTGRKMSMCGGSRYDMWNCSRGDCTVVHKAEECYICKGKGYFGVKEEAYVD
jgi:hypothetical protein